MTLFILDRVPFIKLTNLKAIEGDNQQYPEEPPHTHFFPSTQNIHIQKES